jgi:acyl carrier protein
MGIDEIRVRIKQAIGKVSKIDPETIDDRAAFREDLGLDSLSILETLVEVQCRFKIPDIPDADFSRIRTVEQAVEFVQQALQLEMVGP